MTIGPPVAKAEIHCSLISLEQKNLATVNICRPGKISFQFVSTERETVKISTSKDLLHLDTKYSLRQLGTWRGV